MTQRRSAGSGTLTERPPGSGKWFLRVYGGNDPLTGRPRQRSKTVTARTKTEANRELAKFVSQVEAEPKPGTGATVRVVLEEFLQYKVDRGDASPKTLHEDRQSIEKVICPELGDIPAGQLTTRHIDIWQGHLLTGVGRVFVDDEAREKATKGDRIPKLKPASARRHFAVLSAAMGKAYDWGWVPENICARADAPSPPTQPGKSPTPDQAGQLFGHAWSKSQKWGMLLTLALMTGARRGEVCPLRWTDFETYDHEGELWGMLAFRRRAWRAGTERGELTGLKGGASEKLVTIDPPSVDVLNWWRQQCEVRALESHVTILPDAYIVSEYPDGSMPVNADSFGSAISRWCKDLGVPTIHLHSQRHYAASRMLAGGIDVRNASEILGHADGGRLLLRTYAHGDPDVQRAAARILGAVIDRKAIPAESHMEATK